jgi:sulfatase modifying factor 1
VREPVNPRGRYEAVGKEGRLAAIVSGGVAVGLVVIGLIALVVLGDGADEEDQAVQTEAQAPPRPQAADAPAVPGVATSKDCGECPAMATIPSGMFAMGLRGEEIALGNVPAMQRQTEQPLHGVTLAEAFALGQTEVTRGQFAAFVADTGHQALGCLVPDGGAWALDRSKSWRDPGFSQDDGHPAVCVNHADATAYVDWLSRRTGKRYRLPSETEWEYAARAGQNAPYPWGDKPALACAHGKVADRSHAARFSRKTAAMFFPCETGYAFTAPVANFQPNEFGLYDMYGNVRELVADCWNPDYWGKALGGGARTTGACETSVLRGGGWFDAPPNIRPARRFREDREVRRADQGFRVAKDLPVTTPLP